MTAAMAVFVGLGITSVLDSMENIFSPKSSISSALKVGWSCVSWCGSQQTVFRNTKFPTNLSSVIRTEITKKNDIV